MSIKILTAAALALGVTGGIAYADPSIKTQQGASLFDEGGFYYTGPETPSGTNGFPHRSVGMPVGSAVDTMPTYSTGVDMTPTYSTTPEYSAQSATDMAPSVSPTGSSLSNDPGNPYVKNEAGAAAFDNTFGSDAE